MANCEHRFISATCEKCGMSAETIDEEYRTAYDSLSEAWTKLKSVIDNEVDKEANPRVGKTAINNIGIPMLTRIVTSHRVLGDLLIEYMEEGIHDGFDGVTPEDLLCLARTVEDMREYYDVAKDFNEFGKKENI